MAKDLFSNQAALYAQYRPVYPVELYDFILQHITNPQQAWDCATGNGQAAVELARYFEKVMATDISEKQLQQAIPNDRITYAVSTAEQTPFPDNSFDCITVAQAYHWFQFEAFGKEVQRIARPGAIVAIWGYSLIVGEDEALNTLIQSFYRDTVGAYWDKERRYIDEHYTKVPFPYEPLPSKEFRINVQWHRQQLIGYFNTWSSVQHFIKAHQYNPVDELATVIANLWPDDSIKSFYFPLFLKLGRVVK
ncbi:MULTISPECIES: class I SAM-dependent methyltransferase [Niastella]|uniref:Class I SAM-dependent methyltransferase n=1 Tax=Niastella soli TaxID=2821487 RepID=A0ABS3Z4X6_9BACT|nr:class I SAM-dependent methyltransferase [Niastella soli]MBO9205093.1 class I SAM-dependent methyltransferase [Niastella soli]